MRLLLFGRQAARPNSVGPKAVRHTHGQHRAYAGQRKAVRRAKLGRSRGKIRPFEGQNYAVRWGKLGRTQRQVFLLINDKT